MSISIEDIKRISECAKEPPLDDPRLAEFCANPDHETWSDKNPGFWPYYTFLRHLIRYVQPQHATELGTELGRSCFFMATGCPTATITTLEIGNTPPDTYLRFLGQCPNVKLVMGMDSVEWGLLRLARRDYFTEFLFIDTSHTHDQTLMEWGIYRNLMKYGGVACFDDICTTGVRGCWDEIGLPKVELEFLHKDNGFGCVIVPPVRGH